VLDHRAPPLNKPHSNKTIQTKRKQHRMAKIALIGAGSIVFTRNLCSDILLAPALQQSTIALMDIDPVRLAQAYDLVQAMVEARGIGARVEATLDRRAAVQGADYVITTFQQGGLDAYRMDIETPQRHGIEQCVGDTLGPGGVFRALRSIPVLLGLAQEMDASAPDALLLNYVNPMAANCWAWDRATGRPHVGLCHSVQDTSEMLARWVDVPCNEVNFACAGINHQAFFLSFRQGERDIYPEIRARARWAEMQSEEPVRIELMEHFGYFVTESSGHASEYSPYFRKSAAMVNEALVPRFTHAKNTWYGHGRTGGYLRHCIARQEVAQEELAEMAAGTAQPPTTRSHEYGSIIIEAMETNHLARINGNVPNRGLIANLPAGCCVEVACLVDANGIQPTHVAHYPTQLAALNRTNINVQELIVDAALRGDRDAVFHAVMLDPLTAAVCTLPQIHALVAEMLTEQARWLPHFGGAA
jgi:alpha-galactosidase